MDDCLVSLVIGLQQKIVSWVVKLKVTGIFISQRFNMRAQIDGIIDFVG